MNGGDEMRTAKYFVEDKPTPLTLDDCGDVLNIYQLSQLLGKTKDTITRWCRSGALPATQIEKQYFVLKKDFIEMFQKA